MGNLLDKRYAEIVGEKDSILTVVELTTAYPVSSFNINDLSPEERERRGLQKYFKKY
ncbi:hypothetical protein [Bacillus sp. RO1]|uniref:hypothetical protein n=1 Tax=Bacillus sp. RO1 TaxID=2722703 RepID=UPI001456C633|nr:hypothetical protein [Bacillus sp. RO1]NLP51284.1 hypothetical protein [Bacillus sp. RO1]